MANGKSIGQLREEALHGGPRGHRGADARRMLRQILNSPHDEMRKAVADTPRLLRENSPMTKKGKQEFDKHISARKKPKSAKGFR